MLSPICRIVELDEQLLLCPKIVDSYNRRINERLAISHRAIPLHSIRHVLTVQPVSTRVSSDSSERDKRLPVNFRVMLVDDHRIMREGLRAPLRSKKDIVIVGEADNGVTAVAVAITCSPGVVVMDLSMPKGGSDATRQLMTL